MSRAPRTASVGSLRSLRSVGSVRSVGSLAALAAVASLAACDDGLDQRLAIVREPRVIAVVGEPAEAKPGASVAFHALVVGPDGPIAAPPTWGWCAASKPPTEDNAVSDACIGEDQLLPLGTSPTVTAAIPADACLRFGPDVPPGTDFRPRDPDVTGGFYQPMRVAVDAGSAGGAGGAGDAGGALLAFGLERITCHLAKAPTAVAFDYDQRYVANANPALDPFALGAAADNRVPAGTDVELRASWPAAAAESYLYFDPSAQALADRREAMRVSWYATAGELPADASAVAEADAATATAVSTVWHTPATPGPAWVWIVLRDSRGGIAVQQIAVTVTE